VSLTAADSPTLEDELPLDLIDEAAWVEGTAPKPDMAGGTVDYRPSERGASGRLPDEGAGPLPISGNAEALGYTSPGELAALAAKPRRITFISLGETLWEDYDVDGRHVTPPRLPHPAGLMDAQGSSASVSLATPGPVTAELALRGGSQEDVVRALFEGLG
jgi:hypothetical protein